MLFLYLFLISILSGFVASMPIGPVNLWITQSAMTNRYQSITYFVVGVILADLVYVSLAFSSYFFWFQTDLMGGYDRLLGFVGGLIIMSVGIFNIIRNNKKVKNSFQNSSLKIQKYASFFTGLFLTISNAMVFVFWFFIAGVFESNALLVVNLGSLFLVVLGVMLGDTIWFALFTYLLKKGVAKIPQGSLAKMRLILAISLIIFGLFTACKQL